MSALSMALSTREPAGHANFSVIHAICRVWRAISSPRSDTDCQSVQECLRRTIACVSRIERCSGSSLHFNHSLCEWFVTKYVRLARELLDAQQSEIELHSQLCAPALAALHKTLNEAEFLVQKHCASSHWLWAAVELLENTSAFAEVILDLRWYTHALRIAIETQRTPLVHDLQENAMKEHGDFLETWERECRELSLHGDREALLSKLKVANGAEIRSLDSYLAQKLSLQRQMHGPEPLAVNLNVKELLHKKILLGEGTTGRVYKVQWLGVPCALKQLSSDMDEVVSGEVEILSKLHHPNVIQFYGYFFERGTLYLILEFMDDTLSQFVKTRKEWSALQSSPSRFLLVVLDCMLQIAKAMRYLHRQGMVHLDLKGDNILVKPSENPERRSEGYLSVKLIDFGMARANQRSSTFSSLDKRVGSLPFKAPELFIFGSYDADHSKVTLRIKKYPLKPDVYSFGIVCAEILCGKQPFPNAKLESTRDFCLKVMGGELRPELPEETLPPGLADYIKRCWDTDPVSRPDFRDICKRIRHFRDSLLRVDAYTGWELKPLEKKAAIQEPVAISEIYFVDVPEAERMIEYDDISHEQELHPGSGFQAVYNATLTTTSTRVLAKHVQVMLINSEESSTRFKREVQSLVRIRHPNLVYYLGATGRAPYVVITEKAQGETLRDFLGTEALLLRRDAIRIALQVAVGLARLHDDEVGIIHGELSPDCIVVDKTNMTVKVLNFGLRSFRKEPNKHWRAPEQDLGRPLHTSMDVFAFGLILYELMEYENAKRFWKRHMSKKVQARRRPELGLPSCYPEGVHELINRCWTHNWQERPDFESIVADLRKVDTDLQHELVRSTSISSHQYHEETGTGGRLLCSKLDPAASVT